jgi:hypothetical protein
MDIEITPSQEFWFSVDMLLWRFIVPGLAVLLVVLLIIVVRQVRKRLK